MIDSPGNALNLSRDPDGLLFVIIFAKKIYNSSGICLIWNNEIRKRQLNDKYMGMYKNDEYGNIWWIFLNEILFSLAVIDWLVGWLFMKIYSRKNMGWLISPVIDIMPCVRYLKRINIHSSKNFCTYHSVCNCIVELLGKIQKEIN